jgi:hypothetical protein
VGRLVAVGLLFASALLAGCEPPPATTEGNAASGSAPAEPILVETPEDAVVARRPPVDVAPSHCEPFVIDESPAPRWARVLGAAPGPIHMLSDRKGCPAEGDACRLEERLQPGDVVFVGRADADWGCVAKGADHMTTFGFVSMRELEFLPDTATSGDGWPGDWSTFAHEPDPADFPMLTTRTLRLAEADGKLVASFESFRAPTAGDRSSRSLPAFRFGGVVGADGTIAGPPAAGGDACLARLIRRGDDLAMQTNGECGGVGFGSLFTRISSRTP